MVISFLSLIDSLKLFSSLEFSNDNLLVLTSTAQELSGIDKNSIEALLKDAKTKLNNTEITDKEKYLLSYKIDTLKNISL